MTKANSNPIYILGGYNALRNTRLMASGLARDKDDGGKLDD